jgi:hypothetical protein
MDFVAGTATRILSDADALDGEAGFFGGGRLVLVHDEQLLRLVDDWVATNEDNILTLDNPTRSFRYGNCDRTYLLDDPVDILFGVQLGGGTDIAGAFSYCESQITSPIQTILVPIQRSLRRWTDRKAHGPRGLARWLGRAGDCLLALFDEDKPAYDTKNAASVASLGIRHLPALPMPSPWPLPSCAKTCCVAASEES